MAAIYQNMTALEMATSAVSTNFLDLLRGLSPAIASNGAIGQNIAAYTNVSFQRSDTWTTMLALQEGSTSDLAPAVAAMQFGFQQELPNGSFNNVGAILDWTNYESDAFFLQSFAEDYLSIKSSSLWPTFATQLTALIPKFSSAMTWLATQASALSTADAEAPNRLFLDAIAFELGGQILNNNSYVQTGVNFVNQALALQSPNGYYMEDGGWDSSYNGTSMLAVETLLTYSTNSAQVSQLTASLASAASWEESRISASGEVLTTGNTRTAGQEIGPSGSIKDVNYGEVAASLLYAGTILGSSAATNAGDAVAGYALVHQGGVAQPLGPVSFTVITANASGFAIGNGGNDELVATGPNQTLTANATGGEQVFYVGGNSGIHIVNPGTSLTEVVTSLTNYTLPVGIDNLDVDGAQNHVIAGNGGNNYINGSNGNDTIHGGGGNVVIRVGTGSNMLTGGGQYDAFLFPYASDHNNTITDFHPNQDVLDLGTMFTSSGWSASNPSSYLTFAQQGANTVLSVYPNGTASAGHPLVTLDNVSASQMVSGFNYLV